MRKTILLTTAALLGTTAPVFAADNGIYLGVSVGQAGLDIDNISGAADFKGKDTGYKFIAGIRPLDWLAVEASYVNFGKPDDTVLSQQLKAEGDGISAFAVGFLPVGPFDVFAKAGLLTWDTKVATRSFDRDGTDFAYGAGVQFRLLSLSIRAEYEKFNVDEVDDLDMVSIGVTYTFL